MSSRIRAAIVREKSGPFCIEEIEILEPGNDEILVKMVATGVCHTDIGVRDQSYPVPLPAVLGHEGAGIVEKVGAAVTKVQRGDHVLLTYDFCRQCENCLQGMPGFCTEFYARNLSGRRADGTTTLRSLDGRSITGCFFCQSSFSSKAIASERNVIKLDRDVPLELIGPLGCGIQTGAGAVINSLRPKAGSSIAVFGAGAVGLSAVMAAKVVGCSQIIAVDIKPSRLELAMELGATHLVDGSKTNAVEEIRSLTGRGAHYSLECTSNPRVFRQAVECLQIPGICGLIGAAPIGTEVSFEMASILFGRTIKGIMQGDCVPDVFVPQLIQLWRENRFPFDKLIKFYDFDDINLAVHDAEMGEVVKPVLRFGP